MKRRPIWLRWPSGLVHVLLPALAAGLIGCTVSSVFNPTDLLPTPPEELPDLQGRVVKVALLADRLPFSHVDPTTGAASGFDYDFITEMATRLNFTPLFTAGDPNTLLADLTAGRYDLVGGGIAYTLSRATQFDFACPYGLLDRKLAIRAGDSRASTIAAFHDATALRVGTVTGSTAYDMAVAFFGAARVVGYDTYTAAVDALVAGTVDGVVLGYADLLDQQARLPNLLAALPGPLGGDVLAYALPLGSDLTDSLNDAYLQLQSEGEIAALREQWGF